MKARAIRTVECLEKRRLLSATAVLGQPAHLLTVLGDNADNNAIVTSDADGRILVINGAVPVIGGTPTVANTTTISVFAQNGNDTITLYEADGALPKALLFSGNGNDTISGGSGTDQLFGQAGNDILLGKGGND